MVHRLHDMQRRTSALRAYCCCSTLADRCTSLLQDLSRLVSCLRQQQCSLRNHGRVLVIESRQNGGVAASGEGDDSSALGESHSPPERKHLLVIGSGQCLVPAHSLAASTAFGATSVRLPMSVFAVRNGCFGEKQTFRLSG